MVRQPRDAAWLSRHRHALLEIQRLQRRVGRHLDFLSRLSLSSSSFPHLPLLQPTHRATYHSTRAMLLTTLALLMLGAAAAPASPVAISSPPFVRLALDTYKLPVSSAECELKPNDIIVGGGSPPYSISYEFSVSGSVWGLKHNASEPGHLEWLAGENLQQYVGEPFRFVVTDSLGATAYDEPHQLRAVTPTDECIVK